MSGIFPGREQAQQQISSMMGTIFEQAKNMKQNMNMAWNGKEFATFAEAVEFLRDGRFATVQIISHADKICVFYTR